MVVGCHTSKEREWTSRVSACFVSAASYPVECIIRIRSMTVKICRAHTSWRAARADVGGGVTRNLGYHVAIDIVTRLQLSGTDRSPGDD